MLDYSILKYLLEGTSVFVIYCTLEGERKKKIARLHA